MPIMALFAPRRPSRVSVSTSRHLFSAASDAVRSVVAPAALVQELAPVTAPDPTDAYSPDDMPAVEDPTGVLRRREGHPVGGSSGGS